MSLASAFARNISLLTAANIGAMVSFCQHVIATSVVSSVPSMLKPPLSAAAICFAAGGASFDGTETYRILVGGRSGENTDCGNAMMPLNIVCGDAYAAVTSYLSTVYKDRGRGFAREALKRRKEVSLCLISPLKQLLGAVALESPLVLPDLSSSI